MLKALAVVALLLASLTAGAKTLYADIPEESSDPISAEWRSNGGEWQSNCVIESGKPRRMACNIDVLVTPGLYVLEARYTDSVGAVSPASKPYNYVINEAGMSVTSTFIEDGSSQRGGQLYITEIHRDSAGKEHIRGPYLVTAGFNAAARVAANAVALTAALADEEASQLLQNNRAPVFVHQTAAEFAVRFWSRVQDAYQSGDFVEYGRLLWWLGNRIAAGHITDAQARISFNTSFGRSLTAAQWTTLKTNRLAPAQVRYQAMLDEAAL